MPIQGKSVLAIIPAREGSRRVPLKNLTLYRGTPLIAHAINHAQGSKYIDTIVISSDSPAILSYARAPIIALPRPPHLASDYATSEAVIVHALYATNPLPPPSPPPPTSPPASNSPSNPTAAPPPSTNQASSTAPPTPAKPPGSSPHSP